jgi:hypothetical protein
MNTSSPETIRRNIIAWQIKAQIRRKKEEQKKFNTVADVWPDRQKRLQDNHR